MLAWVLFGAAVATFLPMFIYSEVKRNRLTAYTIMLLTRVDVYRGQREKFIAHSESLEADSADRLAIGAVEIIERLERQMCNLSMPAAGAILWHSLRELEAARKTRGAA